VIKAVNFKVSKTAPSKSQNNGKKNTKFMLWHKKKPTT